MTAVSLARTTNDAEPLEALVAELAGIELIGDRQVVRKRSRDFFWYSPILNAQLNGKSADLIAVPKTDAEVLRIAAAAARHRVPVTPRGAGTGNYGQAVPLAGGILLDLSAMSAIVHRDGPVLRVQPGAKMIDIDRALAPSGYELRIFPSTKRTATIGGFIAGGSGGIGSVTWGGLREPGNILAARIVTLEEEPRVIELRAEAAQFVNRAYGTTGIITELELPLAPRQEWVSLAVSFADFFDAVAFGQAVAMADGIVKKLVTPVAWPLPAHFATLRGHCPDGEALVLAMIAPQSVEAFKALLAQSPGTLRTESVDTEAPGTVPIYEYSWNHTTLQMLKGDRSVTYLQTLYPHDRLIASVRQMHALFGDEVIHHLEFIRFGGHMTASGLPVVRYSTPERLNEIIAIHEANGVFVANPHVVTLEDGSRHKRADVDQLAFKHQVDPYGLLNPGKMRSFVAGEGAT